VFSRYVTTGITIMYVPNIAGDLLLKDHDVTPSNRRHAGRWSSARKTTPVSGEI
jgi:hypothetical protein